MSVLANYFDYPHRRPGLDHSRFFHRYLDRAPAVAWPGGARLLLWTTVHIEHFPMDMTARPFLPIGGIERPYQAGWEYTMRDYGNRVGVFRLMKVLDRHGLRPTVAMNSEVAERYPFLLAEMVKRNWEIAASGVNMASLHHGDLAEETERGLVRRSFETLRRASGQKVTGWHSPAHSQSARTPDLVAECGGRYIADWVNDDMPYEFKTARGSLMQMPLSYDLSDRKILFLQNQNAASYAQQIEAAFDCLCAEAAEKGGRILSLSLSPWVSGQPGRIKTLDGLLGRILTRQGVAAATGEDICGMLTGKIAA